VARSFGIGSVGIRRPCPATSASRFSWRLLSAGERIVLWMTTDPIPNDRATVFKVKSSILLRNGNGIASRVVLAFIVVFELMAAQGGIIGIVAEVLEWLRRQILHARRQAREHFHIFLRAHVSACTVHSGTSGSVWPWR